MAKHILQLIDNLHRKRGKQMLKKYIYAKSFETTDPSVFGVKSWDHCVPLLVS